MTFVRKKQAVKLNLIEAINTMQSFRISNFKKRPAMKNGQRRNRIAKYNLGVKNMSLPLYVYKILITYIGNYLKPSFITLLNFLHNFIPNNEGKTDSVKTFSFAVLLDVAGGLFIVKL